LWFGGKSRVATLVWERFGDVNGYIEPFFGSGAVLLGRPHKPRIETVNDKDGFVANFWRALQADPDAVATHADNPVYECDLHAKHIWLVGQRDDLVSRLEGDPGFYDVKIAGWWAWGLACWIGSGFCYGTGPWKSVDGRSVKTSEGSGTDRKRPNLSTSGKGMKRQLVHLGDAGRGVTRQLVHLGNAGMDVTQQLVHLDGSLQDWFAALADRLRRVRVCCGDWSRIMGDTPVLGCVGGPVGVFLDPPYSAEAGRRKDIYAEDCVSVAQDVREWAIEHGDNPRLRIASVATMVSTRCQAIGNVSRGKRWAATVHGGMARPERTHTGSAFGFPQRAWAHGRGSCVDPTSTGPRPPLLFAHGLPFALFGVLFSREQ